jgi:ADP-ribosylglycohydrolase
VAYAAGDALGAPWEGKTPAEVDWEVTEELPARGDWPRGSTSDDTDQLMLVAGHLIEAKGQVDEREWLTRLAKALPRMRGVGPTTSAEPTASASVASVAPPAAKVPALSWKDDYGTRHPLTPPKVPALSWKDDYGTRHPDERPRFQSGHGQGAGPHSGPAPQGSRRRPRTCCCRW